MDPISREMYAQVILEVDAANSVIMRVRDILRGIEKRRNVGLAQDVMNEVTEGGLTSALAFIDVYERRK